MNKLSSECNVDCKTDPSFGLSADPATTTSTPGFHDESGTCTADTAKPKNAPCDPVKPGMSINALSKKTDKCEADCQMGPDSAPTHVAVHASHDFNA